MQHLFPIHLGLVGRSLGHSFSKRWFEQKFAETGASGSTYTNFEIDHIGALPALLEAHPELNGLNVTVPYKETVLPYITELSAEAEAIGAVNCIHIDKGRLTGFNTDAYGFAQSIKPFLDNTHERALVLGTGGGAKAAAYALKNIGIDVQFVSRSKSENNFTYADINARMLKAFLLIVNATPLGMHPQTEFAPALPWVHLTPRHLVYDLIYNPSETELLRRAKERGATTQNGWSMLQLQAEKNWSIWSR